MEWRLLEDGAHPGAWNMAGDETLTEAVDSGVSPPVLRLYRWHPPCLSLGFSQPFEVANAAFCKAHGVEVVRRPTGGRAVLHHVELTYAVVAPLGIGPFGQDLQAAYRAICGGLAAGLAALGIPAELSGAPPCDQPRPTEAVPCFIGPAAGEVVVAGRKLVGSAMRRIGNTILQHGSILEQWDGDLQAGCLGLADDGSLRPYVITLGDLLGAPPPTPTLANAIACGFSAALGVAFASSALTSDERARAAFLARERYGHTRFTVDRDRSLPPDATA